MKTYINIHSNFSYFLNALAFNIILITVVMSAHHETYKVVHGWPQLPENDALDQVTGVGVDSRNRVFISHRGANPIRAFEAESGKQVAAWGHAVINSPHGLEVDREDNIWITDTGNHQVYKFSNEGKLLMTVGTKGETGADKEHFKRPTSVAVLPSGEFYVADGYGNSRVVKFDKNGEYLLEWGQKGEGPGDFNTVHGITVDEKGKVYVADRSNNRIQVFEGNGRFITQWQSEKIGRPWSVAYGSDGYIYVADGGDVNDTPPERNGAVKLDLNGQVIARWGSFGSYDGQFYWAHDIGVDKDGAVYVVDVHHGMRVQKFVRSQ
jgi:DNA-binding beta-propeller fold protein YncE